jgi:KaiC/GvpD/RAD55 family RecA-like ATPase
MRRVMVRYKVTPERAEENEALVRNVYEELGRRRPAGLRYATFKLEDGVTFVHISEHEPRESPLAELKAFKEFQQDIRARCDEPPLLTELRLVGSYRLLDD